jgi:hypothetical protein
MLKLENQMDSSVVIRKYNYCGLPVNSQVEISHIPV